MFPCCVSVMHLELSDIKILASWQPFFVNLPVLLWPLTGILLLQINTKKGTASCAAELKVGAWSPAAPQWPQIIVGSKMTPYDLPGVPVLLRAGHRQCQGWLWGLLHIEQTQTPGLESSHRDPLVLEQLLWCPHHSPWADLCGIQKLLLSFRLLRDKILPLYGKTWPRDSGFVVGVHLRGRTADSVVV